MNRWDQHRITRLVRIVGPNLSSAAQRKGDMHVHADGCGDLKHYGPGRKFGGDVPGDQDMLINASSLRDIVEEVYPPEDFGYDADSEWEIYAADIYVAPCVKL